jgi:hypothetical protein
MNKATKSDTYLALTCYAIIAFGIGYLSMALWPITLGIAIYYFFLMPYLRRRALHKAHPILGKLAKVHIDPKHFTKS